MTFSDHIKDIGNSCGDVHVRLSNQLIHVLSEQMYSSPVKAIEELVVNTYDADAKNCFVNFVDSYNDDGNLISIFDDGTGMDYLGLTQLWYVGESPKLDHEVSPELNRKFIGKFGIGKLATYAIANKITYLTRRLSSTFHVSCDFREFENTPKGGSSKPVFLTVKEITNSDLLRGNSQFRKLCESIGMNPDQLTDGENKSWTFCVLEALKPKAKDLKIGRLKWVLKTTMPLKSDFCIFVNGTEVKRTKDDFHPVVQFQLAELDKSRLTSLNDKLTDDWKWKIERDALVSEKFPNGLTGEILVTKSSLVTGKSTDIGRSHGFFVFVRDRLINLNDELFGLHALSHATFNFFRADIYADDLHSEVTAPREGLELGLKREVVSNVLLTLFNDARKRQESYEKGLEEQEKRKSEHERSYVPQRLVDRPIADTLTLFQKETIGTDADDNWFFFRADSQLDISAIVNSLYEQGPRKYQFKYDRLGKSERLAKLDPINAEFTLNEDHEVILAYADDPRSRHLLEDFVASEVLLEIYLREAGVNPYVIGEVLERRDLLMRSLAQDHVYSLDAIAQSLLDSSDDKYDLEIALVAAARGLGFNAKHIGNSGEPDGVARFNNFGSGEVKITLEAKSSIQTPQLSGLDFAALADHVVQYEAKGCLLVAPNYPGQKLEKKNNSNRSTAVERRAEQNKISCWTVEDLAKVVRAAEKHQITAAQILNIVLKVFEPTEVSEAVQKLLKSDNMQVYYREILGVLKALSEPGKLSDTTRTIQHIASVLSLDNKIDNVTDATVRNALVQMSNTSKGMLRLSGDSILFSGDIEEFERRISNLTGQPGKPRKRGSFRS